MPVVAHLSDLHFGAASDDLAESLLADLDTLAPDVVVVSGDLTQRARRGQFAHARAYLDRIPGPVLTVPGNHDLPLFDVPRRVFDATGRYRHYVGDDIDPVLTLPGMVLIGLGTMAAWRWKAGHATAEQADAVRRVLAATSASSWPLLVTHHPVLPPRLSGLAGRTRLVEACARGGVAVLLAGHTHVASSRVVSLGREATAPTAVSVVTGTATSTRVRGTPNGYSVLRLDPARVPGARLDVELREPSGSTWSTTCTSTFRWAPGGMAAGGRG